MNCYTYLIGILEIPVFYTTKKYYQSFLACKFKARFFFETRTTNKIGRPMLVSIYNY